MQTTASPELKKHERLIRTLVVAALIVLGTLAMVENSTGPTRVTVTSVGTHSSEDGKFLYKYHSATTYENGKAVGGSAEFNSRDITPIVK